MNRIVAAFVVLAFAGSVGCRAMEPIDWGTVFIETVFNSVTDSLIYGDETSAEYEERQQREWSEGANAPLQ